jgi:regulation of enolase protein 1 (concanavalin A-like superfamily)
VVTRMVRIDKVWEESWQQITTTPFSFLAYETFDNAFHLNWKLVRLDEAHVSLTKHPGKLTISTQQSKNAKPRNMLLIDNPLSHDIDFTVTTSVSCVTPRPTCHQGALLIYSHDDNYLKWSYESRAAQVTPGQTLGVVMQTTGAPDQTFFDIEPVQNPIALRLTRRGTQYEFASSRDGKTFRVHCTKDWGDGKPKQIGLMAQNCGPVDVDTCFDFFEIRTVPAAEAEYQRVVPTRPK